MKQTAAEYESSILLRFNQSFSEIISTHDMSNNNGGEQLEDQTTSETRKKTLTRHFLKDFRRIARSESSSSHEGMENNMITLESEL